ncbi:MAG: glycosyltransferase family 4 protein [Bacteroidota bacterium]
MKKVCIIIRSLANGGAEKQSVLLAKALHDRYETWLVMLSKDPCHEKHMKTIQSQGINHLFLEGGIIQKAKDFNRFLREKQIDILFSYLPSDTVFAGLVGKWSGVPFVNGGVRNAEMPKKKRFPLKLVHNLVLDYSISNCYSGSEKFVEYGFKKEKMLVIPNGLELNQQPIFREESDTIRILSVGRFVEQKDYPTAIKAIATLVREYTLGRKFIYTIMGHGDEEKAIAREIATYQLEDHVEVVINPPNVNDYYRNAHIYLCTSIFEGLSNSVMEAMSFSLPVIATDAGDNDRLVSSRDNGYLLPIKEPNAIAEALAELITSSKIRNKMGERSYQRLQEKYTFEKFRENYISLIEKMGS